MKKHWLMGLTLLGAALIYAARLWLAELTPEHVLTQVFDMNEPTRYVFVADGAQPHIAVVDLLTQQQTTTIVTDTIAQVLALNKDTGQLAYASKGGQTVYLYDISSHEQTSVSVDFPINALLFVADHAQWLAVGEDQLLMVDSKDALKQRRYTGFHAIKTVHYSPLANALWVIDQGQRSTIQPATQSAAQSVVQSDAQSGGEQPSEQTPVQAARQQPTGAIYQYDFADNAFTQYTLPRHWHHYSHSALSPDGAYLVFGVHDAAKDQWQAVLWQTATQQMVAHYPMSAPLIQPYIDSQSTHFLAIDEQGQGSLMSLDNAQASVINVDAFQTVSRPQMAALAWLDTTLLVGGEQEVGHYPINDLAMGQSIALTGAMVDLFVTADSKTALFLQAQTPALFMLHARDATLTHIALADIKQPTRIMMGASNTLCH